MAHNLIWKNEITSLGENCITATTVLYSKYCIFTRANVYDLFILAYDTSLPHNRKYITIDTNIKSIDDAKVKAQKDYNKRIASAA